MFKIIQGTLPSNIDESELRELQAVYRPTHEDRGASAKADGGAGR
jgi:hypothetical protein